jgi:hypothetical protein
LSEAILDLVATQKVGTVANIFCIIEDQGMKVQVPLEVHDWLKSPSKSPKLFLYFFFDWIGLGSCLVFLGLFSTFLDFSGLFWTFLDYSGLFMDYSGLFWTNLNIMDSYGLFWTILDFPSLL